MLSTATDAMTDTERDTLEIDMLDEEWIAREFAAIMTAAGMVRRIRLVLAQRPPAQEIRSAGLKSLVKPAAAEAHRSHVRTRVRSPPS